MSYRLAIAMTLAIGIVRDVRADPGRVRPPARLELDDCLVATGEQFEQAARVEIGPRRPGPDEVIVAITCAAGGLDEGVVIEVRPPSSSRRYAYALRWRAQPVDMRPRLVGLAIAEAISASQIELVAVPSPVAPPPVVATPAVWTFGVSGFRRSFSHDAGVAMLGGGATLTRVLRPSVRLAIDVLGEGDTVVVGAGVIRVLTLSTAPRVLYRVGDQLFAEAGLGARVGVVDMHAETLPDAMAYSLTGHKAVRGWLGPMGTASVGAHLSPRLSVEANLEVGISAVGSTGQMLGTPAASVDGRWLSIGLATTVSL